MSDGKGGIAERIVSDLFEEAGFKVINYGYEHTVPELCDAENPIVGDAAVFIRHQPDLIVVNRNNEAFFIEVKYRNDGFLKKKHLFPYPAAYLVFLTKDHILAQSMEEIYKHGEPPVYLNRLEPFKEIPTSLILDYVKKVRRKLGDETFIGQTLDKLFTSITGKTTYGPKPVKAIIEGLGTTIDGWTRLDNPPDWVENKMERRKSNFVKGYHYNYKRENGIIFSKKR